MYVYQAVTLQQNSGQVGTHFHALQRGAQAEARVEIAIEMEEEVSDRKTT